MATGTELTNRTVVPQIENGDVLMRPGASSAGTWSVWRGRRTHVNRTPRDASGKPVLIPARPHGQDPS